jgi:hypothetical protein
MWEMMGGVADRTRAPGYERHRDRACPSFPTSGETKRSSFVVLQSGKRRQPSRTPQAVERGNLMRIQASCLVAALSLAFAANAHATIVGSTYDFTTSVTSPTEISPLGGPVSHTDPANPGFCVGPPVACSEGTGLSGSFAFAQTPSPTHDTITFTFFGGTLGAGPGTFAIDLGNFQTVDGTPITGVFYISGELLSGDFTRVIFDGTQATFTGSTDSEYRTSAAPT